MSVRPARPGAATPRRRADQPVTTVRAWPGMRSEYSWLPPDGAVTVTRPHQIGVSFTDHRKVVHELQGRAVELDITAGAVFATGAHRVTWARVREPSEALEIYPDLALVRAATASSQAHAVEIEPVAAGRDPTVLGIAAVLKRAHTGGADLDELHASTLAHRLAAHVARHYCGLVPAPRATPGLLDRVLLDRVAELVEERLGEPLTLPDLAAVAALSPFHFARVFKATTGMAPHEYVTMRRMERAKTLLLGTRHSVAQVAEAVGFSNLSHFRRTFRAATGFMPSGLRTR